MDIAGARGAEPATASGAAPPPPPGAAGGSDPAAAAELSKLRSEYEALEQQLEEVSNEAVRLQVGTGTGTAVGGCVRLGVRYSRPGAT